MSIYKKVNISEVKPDPRQPRQEIDPSELLRLRESIQTHGIMNPIIVEKQGKDLLIVDGERRYRAAKGLELKEIPVFIVEGGDATTRLAKRFHLQEQHAGWSTFDKARAVAELQVASGLSAEEIAKMLGITGATVRIYTSLLNLSTRTRSYAIDKRLPLSYLSALGNTLKKIENGKLRQEYEKTLIDRIEAGQIVKYSDVNKLGKAIRVGGEELVRKIVKDKHYTAEKAFKDMKLDGQIYYDRIKASANYLASLVNSGMRAGAHKKFTADGISQVKRTISYLTKYLDNAEIVEAD